MILVVIEHKLDGSYVSSTPEHMNRVARSTTRVIEDKHREEKGGSHCDLKTFSELTASLPTEWLLVLIQ